MSTTTTAVTPVPKKERWMRDALVGAAMGIGIVAGFLTTYDIDMKSTRDGGVSPVSHTKWRWDAPIKSVKLIRFQSTKDAHDVVDATNGEKKYEVDFKWRLDVE